MRPVVWTGAPVPTVWPGATVVCIGSGPSLTQADVEVCHRARTIVVNDAHRLAPWADVLYAADRDWWRRFAGVPTFTGRKYSIVKNGHVQIQPQDYPEVQILKNTGSQGLEMDPHGLRTGHNSGYQAINLAVHLGATRIVLLGYDMHGDHYFGSHPDKTRPPFRQCLLDFQTLVTPLADIGVSIINCTPGSALTCFPMGTIADVLTAVAA